MTKCVEKFNLNVKNDTNYLFRSYKRSFLIIFNLLYFDMFKKTFKISIIKQINAKILWR